MADLSLPSLLPKVVDPAWFFVDKPVDDHEELCKLEEEHQTWVGVISLPRSSILSFVINTV